MKKITTIFIFLLSFNIVEAKTEIDKAFIKRKSTIKNKSFLAYSPDIYEGQEIRNNQVLNKFGCKGNNISPKIIWKNAPVNTKSFAITMYTKDVNVESGWWHWILYNIPKNINKLQEGVNIDNSLLPKGTIYGINDYGEKNYGGICSPINIKYNYTITIYALDIDKIDLPKNSTPAMAVLYFNNHTIAKTQITSFYIGKDENTLFKNKFKSFKYLNQNRKKHFSNIIDKNKKNIKYSFNGNIKTKIKNFSKINYTLNNKKNKIYEKNFILNKEVKIKTYNIEKNKTGKIKEYILKSY